MKKIIILTIIFLMSISKVNASSNVFYENDNGLILSECEYSFISNFIYDGYQNYMSLSDYENIFYNGITCNSKIELGNNLYSLNSTEHSTTSKSLSIKKTCSSEECAISVYLKWKVSPKNRSYDVMGAYLNNTNIIGSSIKTKINTTSFSDIKYLLTGFGTSIKIPTDLSTFNVVQTYRVLNKGTVYASYQHSKYGITLNDSKKYTLSNLGYGGVFLFDDTMKPYFDGMGGVFISM